MNSRQDPPTLKSIKEISKNFQQILDWTENQADDYIYHFVCPTDVGSDPHKFETTKTQDICIAGSAALLKIYEILFPTNQRKWKANDVDIFLLNQNENARTSIGMTDIVKCKESSVAELLLNFDMPICRVAYDFKYDIWISAQCISALYTRRQNLPEYLKDYATFSQLLGKHQTPLANVRITDPRHPYLYNRLTERIKKYQDRGIGVNWINTDIILPWVKNRFHYGEWKM